jgi:hypothetical protein
MGVMPEIKRSPTRTFTAVRDDQKIFERSVDSRDSRSTLCQSETKDVSLTEKETIMRFLGYTLGDESAMPTEPPSPEIYKEMDAFVEEAVKAGVIVATGGIAPTAMGAKVTLKDGEFTVVDGPFTEAKEIIGGWALMECRDMAEAIEWTKRFLNVLGEGETRVRPVFGPE